jgi:adenine/guanine phosphoribosyltransferase-like PRPP-binding protein
MAALPWIRTGVLAHGGTAGAIVELVLVAGVVAILLAVWVGNRRDRKEPHD